MKRLFPFLLAVLLPALAHSGRQGVTGGFRGLHNSDSAVLIDDNEAQDLSNVDLTDFGFGIKKRSGYAQFKTIGVSTMGVRGGYFFRDVLGNDNLIAANDASVYYSRVGSVYAAFITTDTVGSYYDFTDSNGFLWRANSSHDQICRWNGTTLTYYPNHPRGSQIEALPDRLVIAASTANPNRVWFSASADFTDFTLGNLETSAFYEEVGLPGQNIIAIKTMCGGLGAWTKDTLSLWSGTNQFDGQILSVSPNIGILTPSTIIQDGGITYWQAQDGHYYAFDCNTITQISRNLDVSNFGSGVGGNSENSWTVTGTNFDAGVLSNGLVRSGPSIGFMDYTIDNFSDGDYTSNPTWTPSTDDTEITVTGGEVLFHETRSDRSPESSIYTGTISTGTWKVDARASLRNYNSDMFVLKLSSNPPQHSHTENSAYSAIFYGDLLGGHIHLWKANDSLIEVDGPGGVLSSSAKTYSFGRDAEGVLRASIDGVVYATATDTSITGLSYFQVSSWRLSADDSVDVYVDNIKLAYSSASYQSEAHATGSITGWGLFQADSALSGGEISYVIYSDSDTVLSRTDTTTYLSSVTVTNGSIPVLSTGAYFTVAADFSRMLSTHTASLNQYSQTWYGGISKCAYGVVDKDHRLMWSVENGLNYQSYVYDPNFASWLRYSFPFVAPVKVGNSIYFGSDNSAVIYLWPSGNSDTGTAISAYWKSKDFISEDPFTEKDFQSYSTLFKVATGSNIDVAYSIDGATTTSTSNFSLTDPIGIAYRRVNQYLPSGTYGSTINWKFGNDDADAAFEILGFSYDYTLRPWRVME